MGRHVPLEMLAEMAGAAVLAMHRRRIDGWNLRTRLRRFSLVLEDFRQYG